MQGENELDQKSLPVTFILLLFSRNLMAKGCAADQNAPVLEKKQVRTHVMLQEGVFGFNVCVRKT